MAQQEQLQGTVTSVIFKNQENGYAIVDIKTQDDTVTVVGTLPYITPGERIRAVGQWVEHPNYGRQFQIERYEKELPTTIDAIRAYLAGGAIKGVGERTADKLIALFGERTLEVIEHSPEQLSRIRGITAAKAQSISQSFREQFGIRQVILFLQQYGVSLSVAFAVWKCWGCASEDVIRCNPYVLCEMIDGVSFTDADALAERMEFDKTSPLRISSAIKYVLNRNAYGGGHTFIPRDALVQMTAQLIGMPESAVDERVEQMIEDEILYNRPIGNKDAVYLERYYKTEQYCAWRIARLQSKVRHFTEYRPEHLAQVEKKLKLHFNEQQMDAIDAAARSGVMVLTGGPGTGKTTALSGIIALYQMLGVNYALAAPTGRAAKRISELTGDEAKTIHRMLEMQYSGDSLPHFAKNENQTLKYDAIICDEASMIDIDLMQALLRAIPDGCRLVLVGDADQLPPVGPGNMLGDIIASGLVNTVALSHVFRQAADSLIISNAHGILRGEPLQLKGENRDAFLLKATGAVSASQLIVDLAVRRLVNTYDYDPMSDIQVISLSKLGICGTVNLNEHLR
ncbi:MAG: AAA family ATPase, partial [Clostridia bacterium]|nr:AAA family ATPase [Clostridia bacterium]